MRLELLQEIVHGQLGVAVVEADDHADGDHVLTHRIDERAAELPELPTVPERPSHRVHDVAQRLRDLPHLLDAERPHLRVLAPQVEMVERRAGEMPLCALGQDRHARRYVRARLEVPELLAAAPPAAIAGAHAHHPATVHEEPVGRCLREDGHAERLGLVAEPAAELGQRSDMVTVIHHRGRRRDAQRFSPGQEQHRLPVHLAVERHLVDPRAPLEQPLQRQRVDHRAREQVRTGSLSFLEQGDRNFAEPIRQLGMLLRQLAQPDRSGQTRRACADDQKADVDSLVDRVGRRDDRLRSRPRRRILGWANAHDARARTSSTSLGTIACRSPTTPRSENSKIGALASLLIATITFEPCMPTLCWIAPEMPSAT